MRPMMLLHDRLGLRRGCVPVEGSEATAATPISLATAGLTERAHLQEWVIAHPEIVSPGALMLRRVRSVEQRYRPAKGQIGRLALGRDGGDGRRVEARSSTETVEMQAIKYAAMASRFTEQLLAEQHARIGCIARTRADRRGSARETAHSLRCWIDPGGACSPTDRVACRGLSTDRDSDCGVAQ